MRINTTAKKPIALPHTPKYARRSYPQQELHPFPLFLAKLFLKTKVSLVNSAILVVI
ncbi:hypothetical protein QT971_27175 [Microcoleus sp. herbarium19]|uniref:hypothetical protein n=1 Tax=unclassified Microcoleus TaxID=2642155 RepID=UPI002FD30691